MMMNAVILSMFSLFSPVASFDADDFGCKKIEWVELEDSDDSYRLQSRQECSLGYIEGLSVSKITAALVEDKRSRAEKWWEKEYMDAGYQFSTVDDFEKYRAESDVYLAEYSYGMAAFWMDSKILEAEGNMKRIKSLKNKLEYSLDEKSHVKVKIINTVEIEKIKFLPSKLVTRIIKMYIKDSLDEFRPKVYEVIRGAS